MRVFERVIFYDCPDKRLFNALMIAAHKADLIVFTSDCHASEPVGLSGTVIHDKGSIFIKTFPEHRKVFVLLALEPCRIDSDKFFWEFRRYITP